MQQFCLRWNNHQPNFISVFSSLLNSESLVDVTLAAEGRHLQAHKVVLSACSSYFQSLFTVNPCQHPIVILKDVKFVDLKVMVDFMYYGEVNVSQEQLPHILKTAEMLKIKGLAEMPDSTSLTKSQSGSTDRAELLTPGDSNWSSDALRRSSSPSPCPLSPGSRRKRLRKSSTGSGSGSTERTSEEHPNEAQLTSPSGSLASAHIKQDPGFTSDCSTPQRTVKQHSSDSEPHRDSSQESVEGDTSHQITLQIPQQSEISLHNMEPASVDIVGPSASSGCSQPPVTEKLSTQTVIGPKRGRLLIRQPRVKKEIDPSQPSVEGEPASHQFLSVPRARVERQCSEPVPSLSPPPLNLLAVPGSGLLVKQHSHPLLPSQTQMRSSTPLPGSSAPLPVHFLVPTTSSGEAERAISPIVTVTDPLSITTETVVRADSATTATLRVRTEELKRSVSSPQTGSPRASHCPVVRQGPALGCNFCWNTVDDHGRILRRKTKYHCPECQTNLCIVPCFQEYHERHNSRTTTDPSALTSAVMRIFPKTSSM